MHNAVELIHAAATWVIAVSMAVRRERDESTVVKRADSVGRALTR